MPHDWYGPISLGWALLHREQVAGVVLLNTAVHQPAGSPAPTVIRLARSAPLLRANTVRTPAFVRATTGLSGRGMPREVAAAFAAPYAGAARREAVATFVADIPLEDDHPSAAALTGMAEGIRSLDDVPVLLLWGPGDPVFSDRYLTDLLDRLPHADVHRYEGARHLVSEDAPALVTDLLRWVADLPACDASSPVGAAGHQKGPTADEPSAEGESLWAEIGRAHV